MGNFNVQTMLFEKRAFTSDKKPSRVRFLRFANRFIDTRTKTLVRRIGKLQRALQLSPEKCYPRKESGATTATYDRFTTRLLIAPGFIPRPKTKPSEAINFDHKFWGRGKDRCAILWIASLSTFFVKREMCAAIGSSDFFLRFHWREMLNTETRELEEKCRILRGETYN